MENMKGTSLKTALFFDNQAKFCQRQISFNPLVSCVGASDTHMDNDAWTQLYFNLVDGPFQLPSETNKNMSFRYKNCTFHKITQRFEEIDFCTSVWTMSYFICLPVHRCQVNWFIRKAKKNLRWTYLWMFRDILCMQNWEASRTGLQNALLFIYICIVSECHQTSLRSGPIKNKINNEYKHFTKIDKMTHVWFLIGSVTGSLFLNHDLI